MVKAIREWKGLIPGEECFPGYILLRRDLLKDGTGISMWRTKKIGTYSVELWVLKGPNGLPIWGGNMEGGAFRKNYDKAEEEYRKLIKEHGGLLL